MALLLDDDYARLSEIGFEYEEDEENRFFVFPTWSLPLGIYNTDLCATLIVIPTNYDDGHIDCLWVSPHLSRRDGKAVPQASAVGASENHFYKGKEFCRWSRHWKDNWKSGVLGIDLILRRLGWAFKNPDAGR